MYEYNAECLRVIDGDTIVARIDLGFDLWAKKTIRLEGINAPESRTRDLEEKKRGLIAKGFVVDIMREYDNKFELHSKKVGKYGRCLGKIYFPKGELGSIMIKEGHAVMY